MDREIAREIKSRTSALVGDEGMKTLEDAHVVVCGLGGVGSYAVEALARSGVGFLTLIDFDRVSFSNINRQLPALLSTVGEYKTEAFLQRIRDINPDCRVAVRNEFIDAGSVPALIGEADYLVDAIDSVQGKVALIRYAKEHNIPFVSAMGAGNKLAPEEMEITDISRTSACPLARVMRRELRKYGITKGVRVVFSKEGSSRRERLEDEGRQVPASIAFVPGTAGLLLASVVVRDLLGLPIKIK